MNQECSAASRLHDTWAQEHLHTLLWLDSLQKACTNRLGREENSRVALPLNQGVFAPLGFTVARSPLVLIRTSIQKPSILPTH